MIEAAPKTEGSPSTPTPARPGPAGHDERSMAADTLLLAGSMSLTGRYAPQGRLAAAGLHQAVQDVRNRGGVRMANRHLVPDVVILDDESTREGVRHSLDRVSGADLLVGPYGRSRR
jgi:ABC-type branched-subunit amino acid transport system substrate-binding protein